MGLMIKDEVDLEFPELNYTLPKENCYHCGGIMRYYRGTVSCMMCGRDHTHTCSNCIEKKPAQHMASPAGSEANGAAA